MIWPKDTLVCLQDSSKSLPASSNFSCLTSTMARLVMESEVWLRHLAQERAVVSPGLVHGACGPPRLALVIRLLPRPFIVSECIGMLWPENAPLCLQDLLVESAGLLQLACLPSTLARCACGLESVDVLSTMKGGAKFSGPLRMRPGIRVTAEGEEAPGQHVRTAASH